MPWFRRRKNVAAADAAAPTIEVQPDPPVIEPAAPHALDQGQAQHRLAAVGAFAFVAGPILVLSRLEEDFDDGAFVDAAALGDLEPALRLAGVLVHLLPQTHGRGFGGLKREARGAERSDDDQFLQ